MNISFGKISRYIELLYMPDDEIEARGYDKKKLLTEIRIYFSRLFHQKNNLLEETIIYLLQDKYIDTLCSNNSNEILKFITMVADLRHKSSRHSYANKIGNIFYYIDMLSNNDVTGKEEKEYYERLLSVIKDYVSFHKNKTLKKPTEHKSDVSQCLHIIHPNGDIEIDVSADKMNIIDFLCGHNVDIEIIENILNKYDDEIANPTGMTKIMFASEINEVLSLREFSLNSIRYGGDDD